jgi:hypothetical protein
MAEDIFINENRDTEWDEIGDIRTVTDDPNDARQIRQSLAISVMEAVGLGAPTFSDNGIESYRGEIEDAIRSNPASEPPISVIVTNVNYDEQSITFEARTNRVTLEIYRERLS